MTVHPTTGFDLAETDRLLTTTKQVRQRLDLTRPVPYDVLLECIEVANHAPMGGNLERNRWMIIDDAAKKAAIATRFGDVGRPYLAANSELRLDDRSQRVISSANFLVDHLHEVPALVLALRLDRAPLDQSQGQAAAYYGSVLPGVWSFQLALHAHGLGSVLTTAHQLRQPDVAAILGLPLDWFQVALLPVAYKHLKARRQERS